MFDENLRNAFGSSFVIKDFGKIASAGVLHSMSAPVCEEFAKYAGIRVEDPTIDNVEDTIKQQIENELSGFEGFKPVPIIEISPKLVDSNKKSGEKWVKDATGLVQLPVLKKVVEIPFLVSDGDILSFDVIQMDGQRVPYSRENLRKVIAGVHKMETSGAGSATNNGAFVRLQKNDSPMTSTGFLSDTLAIRNTVNQRRGHAMLTTASFLDDSLEKISTCHAMTDDEYETLAKKASEALSAVNKKELEKIAEEANSFAITRAEDQRYLNRHKKLYKNAKELPHGALIKFFERRGNSIEKVKGMVFKLFKTEYCTSPNDLKDSNKQADIPKRTFPFVLSERGYVYPLDEYDTFQCELCEPDDNHFAYLTAPIKALGNGSVFMVLEKDGATSPLLMVSSRRKIIHKNDMTYDATGHPSERFPLGPTMAAYEFGNSCRDDISSFPPMSDLDMHVQINAVNLPKINSLRGVFLRRTEGFESSINAGREILFNLDSQTKAPTFISIPSMDWRILARVPHEQKTLPIKGEGIWYISPVEALRFDQSVSHEASSIEAGLEKLASPMGFIRIECQDRYKKIYHCMVRYNDKSKRMFNQMKQELKYINEYRLREVLKILKFDDNSIRSLILRARNEPSVIAEFSDNVTPMDFEKLKGNITNLSKETMKQSVKKFINPENLMPTLAKLTVAATVGSAARAGVAQAARKGKSAAYMQEQRKQAEMMSKDFEKMAMEKQSAEYLNMAKIATLCHNFYDMACGLADGEIYLDAGKVADDILSHKKDFEKIAGELVDLRVAEVQTGKRVMPFEKTAALVDHIGNLVELAAAVKRSVR